MTELLVCPIEVYVIVAFEIYGDHTSSPPLQLAKHNASATIAQILNMTECLVIVYLFSSLLAEVFVLNVISESYPRRSLCSAEE